MDCGKRKDVMRPQSRTAQRLWKVNCQIAQLSFIKLSFIADNLSLAELIIIKYLVQCRWW